MRGSTGFNFDSGEGTYDDVLMGKEMALNPST
jgi:hypothetical protein